MNSTLFRFHKFPQLVYRNCTQIRCFSVTSSRFLKEIVHETSSDRNTIVISGKFVPSPRENNIVQLNPNVPVESNTSQQSQSQSQLPSTSTTPEKKPCVLCQLKAQGLSIKHTDVLVINQFIDTLGNQLSKNVTGLCNKEHKRMNYLITMAKHAGLIKGPMDPEPTQRPDYMKYNKYYDESVIDEFFTTRRKKH